MTSAARNTILTNCTGAVGSLALVMAAAQVSAVMTRVLAGPAEET